MFEDPWPTCLPSTSRTWGHGQLSKMRLACLSVSGLMGRLGTSGELPRGRAAAAGQGPPRWVLWTDASLEVVLDCCGSAADEFADVFEDCGVLLALEDAISVAVVDCADLLERGAAPAGRWPLRCGIGAAVDRVLARARAAACRDGGARTTLSGVADAPRELEIVRAKCPGVPEKLSAQIVAFVQKLRREELFKLPGVAETLDWTNALGVLDRIALDPATIDDTLGALLKYQDDIAKVRGTTALKLLKEVEAEAVP